MRSLVAFILTVFVTVLAAAPARSDFALAFGNNGKRWAFGSLYNAGSVAEASKSALANCGLKACRVVLSGRGQCAAIAISGQNSAAAWETAETLPEARERALVQCSEAGRRCTVKAAFCDTATPTASAPAQPPFVPEIAAAPPAAVVPPVLTDLESFILALKRRLRSCFVVSGSTYGADDTARLVLRFDRAGNLSPAPRIATVGSGSNASSFATRLIVALNRCEPYAGLPEASTYALKDITVDFSRADFQ